MKEKIKKVIKVGVVLTAVYLIGRSKGVYDVCEKYNDNIDVNEVRVGLFGKNEKPGSIYHIISKNATETATDAK